MLIKNGNLVWDGWKTFWEKKKMLVTSIFSFSHNVCKKLLSQGCLKSGFCGKELTLYHTIPTFNDPREEGLEKKGHCNNI